MEGQTNDFAQSSAKKLRKAMTDAERLLWRRLRGGQLGVKFRRQHAFENYILDFVCIERRLVIEIDGGQHVQAVDHDEERSRRLTSAGFTVLRFWNNEVIDEMDVVMEVIWSVLNPSPP